MMDCIEKWATILSPVVAVLIAAYMTYKSNKDTRKQILGLKNLCIMQISNTIDMLEIEVYKYSLGKAEDQSELRALSSEMLQLRKEENVDPKEMTRLQHKIDKLSKSVVYKDNFAFRIINRQFALMKEIENIKRMK